MSQGIEAPVDVQPWLLEKEGMRTNHGQIIPYISKDLQDHRQIYSTIARVYADLFEWVRQMVRTGILGTCACLKPYVVFRRWRLVCKKSLNC
jgi:hypothetical protein